MSEPAHGSSYAQLQQQLDAANAEIERLKAALLVLVDGLECEESSRLVNERPEVLGAIGKEIAAECKRRDTENERLRAELAASGNYIANAEVAPTFIAFANKRTVKIVDGALEVGWLDDRDEEIAGPVAWKYAVGIKGSLALDQVSKLKAELATARNDALENARGNGKQVLFYEREFYVLSNFSAFKVNWRGIVFDTAEHAYHWTRFPAGSPERQIIRESASAHDAFRFAQENKPHQVSNWEAVKVDVMRDILQAKTEQHEYVRRKLLETGERELIEDSWRDDFWGWGPNKGGQNVLGKLWMEIRGALKREGGV